MGFGLCNAPYTFSRLMTQVIEPSIDQFEIVYLDDIYIYSKSPEEYLDYIRKVLTALRENTFFIKMDIKCLNGWLSGKPDILVLLLEWH